MTLKYNFSIESEKRVIELRDSLDGILKELGLELVEEWAHRPGRRAVRIVRGKVTEPKDIGIYFIMANSEKVGSYEFRLKNGGYRISLDITKLAAPQYEILTAAVGRRFPEIHSPAYTR